MASPTWATRDRAAGRRSTSSWWNHLELAEAAHWLEQTIADADSADSADRQPETEEPAAEQTNKANDQAEQPQSKPSAQAKSTRFLLKPFDSITVSTVPNYLVKGILPRTGLVVVWGPHAARASGPSTS